MLDRMETPDDFIKYYYYLLPNAPLNYTANVTVTSLTPGFFPNMYIMRNDVINSSLNLNSLAYPTLLNFT